MTANNARDIFLTALGRNETDRAAYLQQACGDDTALRQRVEALLRAHDEPGAFLSEAKPDPNVTASVQAASPLIGAIIAGRYKLLEEIGDGGMGTVWMAEQREPVKRLVAVKLIKAGMDSKAVLARFEAERQALAMMDHPNIAKVLDGGTTEDGRPFFVMELVKGLPLTEYCDIRKLSVKERLDLFVQICSAVQHAHQKAVIHRDLKPTNVLVTEHDGKPVPKVIDFGLAKALNASQMLTDRTLHTAYGTVVGTPLYMAPEQVGINALDVDTRTDIYALGVILYELLTGSTPLEKSRFKEAAWDEVKRLIREEEPPKPSTRLSSDKALPSLAASRQVDPAQLHRMVRGELDWIVMKALEKERSRRYETASGLAKDVQRYLAGDAVEACPPTLGYRLRKAYQRNRAAVLTAGAFAIVLLAGIGVSLAFAIEAGRARQDAELAGKAASFDRDSAIVASKEAEKRRVEANDALTKLRDAQEQQAADQYVWDMQSLSAAFEANNTAEMTRLLNRHKPRGGQSNDRRGFEWFHWDRRLHSEIGSERLPVAKGRVAMQYSVTPDGSHVAWVAMPPQLGPFAPLMKNPGPALLNVMNLETRKVHSHELPNLEEQHGNDLSTKPIVSRDGRRVAFERTILASAKSPKMKQSVQVLDVGTGEVLLELDWTSTGRVIRRGWSANKLAFSQDGNRIALVMHAPDGEDKFRSEVRVWQLDAKKEVCSPLPADELADTPFSSDGNHLVTARIQELTTRRSDRVSVWDLTTGAESAGWDLPESSCLHTLAYNPVGNQVAGVSGNRPVADKDSQPSRFWADQKVPEPKTLLMWSPASKKQIRELPLPERGTDLAFNVRSYFSPDGSRLAVFRNLAQSTGIFSWSTDLTLWDSASCNPLPAPQGMDLSKRQGSFFWPTLSPDGRQLLMAEFNVLRTWDTATGRPIQSLLGHDGVLASSFSPDGQRIRSIDFNGLLKEWSAQPMNQVAIPITSVDSNLLVSQDAAISADGNRVFAVVQRKDPKTNQSTHLVRVWNDQGRLIHSLVAAPRAAIIGERFQNYYLTASPDGRRVMLYRDEASAPAAKPGVVPAPDITVWDVETEDVLYRQNLETKEGDFNYATMSPDGRYVAIWTSHTVDLTGRLVTSTNTTVRVIDLNAKGRERLPIAVPQASNIRNVEFHPDGRRVGIVASLKPDNPGVKLFVCDLESNSVQPTVELPFTGEFRFPFVWSPDGKRVLFGDNMSRGGPTIHNIDAGPAPGKQLEMTAGEGLHVRLQAWSPNGKRTAGITFQPGGAKSMLKMWDAENGREVMRIAVPSNVTAMTFRKDGNGLILASTAVADSPRKGSSEKNNESVGMNLLLTTLDATPVPDRDMKK